MECRVVGRAAVLGLAVILAGCGDDESGLPAMDSTEREACPATETPSGPRLPLLASQTTELVLPLGELPPELAFDYRTEFSFWVTSVEVSYDFDRAVSVDPVVVSFDAACPAGVSTASFLAGLPEEGVFSGFLAATDEQTGTFRQTRLTFARGDSSWRLELPEVPDTDQAAWVLYEPAEGRGRVAIARTEWGGIIELNDIPSGLAEVAVVGAVDVVFDEQDDAFYVPDDFGETWRSLVSPWFGAVVSGEPEDTVKLTEIRSAETPPDPLRALTAQETLADGADSFLVAVIDREAATEVEVPCTAQLLRATVFGFAEVTNAEETAARGEPLDIPIQCSDETTEIDLSVTVQNQRVATLRLELF